MKVVATLIITKKYFSQEEIKQTVKDIETYIYNVEKLYLLNLTKNSLDDIYNKIKKYNNVEVVFAEDLGQVYNYNTALSLAHKDQADFGVIMELGYFYEESDFLVLKRYAIANPDTCVITPNPVYTCEEPQRQEIQDRTIKGCHLVGTLINMNYYKERGFVEKYYQTTFDYEYCLHHRAQNRKIVLMINAILRNANYKIKERRFLFATTYIYDRDLLDLYYEVRNRHYLWDEYKSVDPEFVKIDKKDYKKEIKEMRLKDKGYKEKALIINRALNDYYKGITGKKQEG